MQEKQQEQQVFGVSSVRNYLAEKGFADTIVELSQSAGTAVQAADALGTTVAQIAKSLIFKGKESGQAILVIASGANRVDEKKIGALCHQRIGKADADFVKEKTGYAIGGVPPVAHVHPLITFIDEDLLAFKEIWAAAGHPHAVFKLTPAQLVELTSGQLADLALDLQK